MDEAEKRNIRIKGLQRRVELITVKQLHKYERTGTMGERFDRELTKYMNIINGLRKEAAQGV